jgi:hypothetical protein
MKTASCYEANDGQDAPPAFWQRARVQGHWALPLFEFLFAGALEAADHTKMDEISSSPEVREMFQAAIDVDAGYRVLRSPGAEKRLGGDYTAIWAAPSPPTSVSVPARLRFSSQ